VTALLVALGGRPSLLRAQAPPSSPQTATPEQQAEARTRFDRGVALFGNRDYGAALAEFRAAYALSHRTSVLYNIGATERALHRYPEAARAIEQYLREADLPAAQRASLETGLAELRGYIGHVRIAGVPRGAEIRIDGDPVATGPADAPVAVSAGRHEVEIRIDGRVRAHEVFMVAGGQTADVSVAVDRPEVVTRPRDERPVLIVRATPTNSAAAVDGLALPLGVATRVDAGTRALRVEAPAHVPWSDRVDLTAGTTRSLHIDLARTDPFGLVPFIALAAGTGAFVVATSVFGILALDAQSRFRTLTRDDARAPQIASEGTAWMVAADVGLGLSLGAAIAGVIVATRTRFVRAAPVVRWSASGATASWAFAF